MAVVVNIGSSGNCCSQLLYATAVCNCRLQSLFAATSSNCCADSHSSVCKQCLQTVAANSSCAQHLMFAIAICNCCLRLLLAAAVPAIVCNLYSCQFLLVPAISSCKQQFKQKLQTQSSCKQRLQTVAVVNSNYNQQLQTSFRSNCCE